ncbi:MAG TPA: GNAT family N-acetyltransferase [Vicinamibacterales bacterium]|nr:GNAT family N-acetyltransferase [Vicinamibacterales bacterium]
MTRRTAARAEASPAAVTSTSCLSDLASLERALADGLLDDWRRVVQADPLASLYQSPGWCMAWYRAYRDDYAPFVVVVRVGGSLVGIVPFATDRRTRELIWASNTMADYRDIVALPGHRATVVAEVVRCYLEGHFANPLQLGWCDPASDTPALAAAVCRSLGLSCTVRTHPCWRWFPPAPAKPSAQKFLNWYKRNGTVSFDVIESETGWQRFREAYYRQHSLRQIQAGRQTSFDDARKAALYEALFHSPDVQCHVTAFSLDGEMLAGHFGYVWRGVLLLGPPSIRLEDEQRSPAVILLSWIIQNAERLGLAGFDLTIGDSDFKKRLGNQCVELTMIEIHRTRRAYYAQAARDGAVALAKTAFERVAGPGTWKTKVKPAAAYLSYKRERIAEMGVLAALRVAARALRSRVYDRRDGLVYAMTAEQLRPVQPRLSEGETFEVHDNRVGDLLLWNGESPSTASLLTHCARIYSRGLNAGRTFHTIVVSGRLAGWGYSYMPSEPAQLTETPGATLEFEPGAASLYDFHVLPDFRGRRLYQALLTDILRKRFAAGATRAYITVLESNAASRAAIERVGFQAIRRNCYRRLFRRQSLSTRPASVPAAAAATASPAR